MRRRFPARIRFSAIVSSTILCETNSILQYEDGTLNPRIMSITCNVQVNPGERLSLPDSLIERVGEGRWTIIVQPTDETEEFVRNHSAFLAGYAPEDEGLYDDHHRG